MHLFLGPLVWLRTFCNNVPLKAIEENNFIPNIQIYFGAVAEYAERIQANSCYVQQNETVSIHRICITESMRFHRINGVM